MNRRLFTLSVILPVLAFGQKPEKAAELPDPAVLNQRGTEHFFAGRIVEALADWDQVVKLLPAEAPHHWQRGIALYYAGRYEEGVAQFETHQTVNPQDVENAVWHFLCVVRAKGGSVKLAREKYIPITRDTRVPMKEIHALFAGTGNAEAVLAAANANAEGERLRNQLCYAHLYLGLYCEALGDNKKSAEHMKLAAVDYKMDHYMGKVAQVHHRLRSAEQKDGAEGAPGQDGEKGENGGRQAAGKFTILDKIQEDGGELKRARQNAADSLTKYPELDAMVGIWAYNAPQCLEAIKASEREKRVMVFAFDEAPAVLEAIAKGSCAGTIVQSPYQLGFEAIEQLKKLALDGDPLQVPVKETRWAACQTITRDNLAAYRKQSATERKRAEDPAQGRRQDGAPTFAFITNIADPWWLHAQAGCYDAAGKLKVSVRFITNTDGDVGGQNRILENVMNDEAVAGVAVSVLDPGIQSGILDQVAARKPLITVDSDAPDSKRRLHIGTNTYESGRMMGRLMKERMPDGGNIMIYVGVLKTLNARQRCQGLIDELNAP